MEKLEYEGRKKSSIKTVFLESSYYHKFDARIEIILFSNESCFENVKPLMESFMEQNELLVTDKYEFEY